MLSNVHPLSQGLCVFLWNFLSCVAAEPLCKEEEYSVGDQCCPMCNPGRSSSRSRAVPGTPGRSLLASRCSVQWRSGSGLYSVQSGDIPWWSGFLSLWDLCGGTV